MVVGPIIAYVICSHYSFSASKILTIRERDVNVEQVPDIEGKTNNRNNNNAT